MKLNKLEFLLMNNPIRRLSQSAFEMPILKKMAASSGYESVLEIGCGCGNGVRLIRRHFKPRYIAGIDLDEKMIRIAKKRNAFPDVAYQVMDAAKLDFPDKTFDAVLDFGIIHHLPDWKDCVSELHRVLKKDGDLILEELSIESFTGFPGKIGKSLLDHPYERMFSVDEFILHLRKTGFIIRKLKKSNFLKLVRFFSLTAKRTDNKTV